MTRDAGVSLGAHYRMVDIDEKARLFEVRVGGEIFTRVHDRCRDAMRLEGIHHLARRVPHGPSADLGVEFLAVTQTLQQRGIAVGKLDTKIEHRAERIPLGVVARRDHAPLIIAGANWTMAQDCQGEPPGRFGYLGSFNLYLGLRQSALLSAGRLGGRGEAASV